MSDYIERQAAIDALENKAHLEWAYLRIAMPLLKTLEAIPAADVVQVVRCKDCERCEYDAVFEQYWCKLRRLVKPDDYCSYGERKE